MCVHPVKFRAAPLALRRIPSINTPAIPFSVVTVIPPADKLTPPRTQTDTPTVLATSVGIGQVIAPLPDGKLHAVELIPLAIAGHVDAFPTSTPPDHVPEHGARPSAPLSADKLSSGSHKTGGDSACREM